MIEKTVQIEATPENIVELLWNLDNKQVAEVFSLWAKKYKAEIEKLRANKETVWIHDLPHFWLYVIDEMDDDAKSVIRDLYAMQLYRLIDDPTRKHLTEVF